MFQKSVKALRGCGGEAEGHQLEPPEDRGVRAPGRECHSSGMIKIFYASLGLFDI